VFHFLDGVYLFLAFVWLSLLVLAWVFSGLRRKFPNQPPTFVPASALSRPHTSPSPPPPIILHEYHPPDDDMD